MRQFAPLYISYDIYEPEDDDPEVYRFTKKSDFFDTDYGEICISERIVNVLIEEKVTGVEFKRIDFAYKDTPPFYQAIIKNKAGSIYYPVPEVNGWRCPTCHYAQISSEDITFYDEIPYDSCHNLNIDWRAWAYKYHPGEHPEMDFLVSREKYGYRSRFMTELLISPKICQLLLKYKVPDYVVSPVQFV
jgi:hypothetical protein